MPQDDKARSLRRFRSLNPHPERVRDPLFLSHAFLRSAGPRPGSLRDGAKGFARTACPSSETAERFGVTRPTWYEADRNCRNGGLPALVPEKARAAGRAQAQWRHRRGVVGRQGRTAGVDHPGPRPPRPGPVRPVGPSAQY